MFEILLINDQAEKMAISVIHLLNKSDYLLLTMVFLLAIVHGDPYSDNGKSSGGSQQNHISSSGVVFTTRNNTRVIAQRGGLAILPCAVKWNPSATVSWIRRRDFQLLTVGLSTYSSDDRFLVEHARHMGHWSLRIKSVRDEDRGLYECQLSIHPTQSVFVELKVVEAVADIIGEPDLHIDEGSTLRLECKLKRATENPSYVFWYHDNKMVNYDTQDGFSVSSFQNQHMQHHATSVISNNNNNNINNFLSSSSSSSSSSGNGGIGDNGGGNGGTISNNNSSSNNFTNSSVPVLPQTTYLKIPSTSVLTIQEVHFKHAGNYTCAPSNARPTSITVHVLRGEKPAAMQHANRSSVDDVKSSSNSIHHYHKIFQHKKQPQQQQYTILFIVCIINSVIHLHIVPVIWAITNNLQLNFMSIFR